ncbi:MAG TPA: prephenate dehydratase [Thermomicrobiaceae bacterium]|nr:prephenate dehydratase [Thermomicrobiaceae bacterium]
MRIAYLGPAGTFSEEAAIAWSATEPADLVPFASFPALVSAAETGLTERAILPIENSLEGPVGQTVDLLIHETQLKIRGELVLPVRHFLLVVPGTSLEDIRAVSSHPQALGQCRRFLERCLPRVEQIAALSTSAAVESVIAAGDRSQAAIGTLRAGELYDARVLARDIQDNHNNVTRFVVLAFDDAPPTGHDKTSLCFSVRANVPGALHDILTELATSDIQMTKVESRPMKSKLGDYYFLVDIEGHRHDPRIADALDRISTKARELMVFGSYRQCELPGPIARTGNEPPSEW